MRQTGAVRYFNDDRRRPGCGFGYIRPDDDRVNDGIKLFFHRSDIVNPFGGSLLRGQRVTFEIGRDEKGAAKAVSVEAEKMWWQK